MGYLSTNMDFNTTLVSVRLCVLIKFYSIRYISIQHLFRFDSSSGFIPEVLSCISIQHLFRFDFLSLSPVYCNKDFNTTLVSVRPKSLHNFNKIYYISIQHLFRFDTEKAIRKLKDNKFQYNTCFGSTLVYIFQGWEIEHFNTTLVSVRQKLMSSLMSLKSISIQHLFRFDRSYPVQFLPAYKFQYNTCFGST